MLKSTVSIQPIPVYDDKGDVFRIGTITFSEPITRSSNFIFPTVLKYLYTNNVVIPLTEGLRNDSSIVRNIE